MTIARLIARPLPLPLCFASSVPLSRKRARGVKQESLTRLRGRVADRPGEGARCHE